MKKGEFYKRFTGAMADAITELTERNKELAELKQKAQDTRKYKPEYISSLRQRIAALERENIRYEEEANDSIKKLCGGFADELRQADALNPADITDDAKLLNCGLKLKRSDLENLFDKYNGNRTMQRLILDAAETNGIQQFERVLLPSESAELAKSVESMAEGAKVAIRHYDRPDVQNRIFTDDIAASFTDD